MLAGIPKSSAPRYRTSDWSRYKAALKRQGSLSIWFDPDLDWRAARTGKRGHPETFLDQAIQTCLTCERSCAGCHCARPIHGNATGPSNHGEGPGCQLDQDGAPRLARAGLVNLVPPSGQDIRSRSSGDTLVSPQPAHR